MSTVNTNLVIMVVLIWILLALVVGIGEGVYLGQSAYGADIDLSQSTTIYTVTHPQEVGFKWFGAMFDLFTFNLPVFTGGWVIFQWILFAPLTVALFVGFFGMVGTRAALIFLGILGISQIVDWLI